MNHVWADVSTTGLSRCWHCYVITTENKELVVTLWYSTSLSFLTPTRKDILFLTQTRKDILFLIQTRIFLTPTRKDILVLSQTRKDILFLTPPGRIFYFSLKQGRTFY